MKREIDKYYPQIYLAVDYVVNESAKQVRDVLHVSQQNSNQKLVQVPAHQRLIYSRNQQMFCGLTWPETTKTLLFSLWTCLSTSPDTTCGHVSWLRSLDSNGTTTCRMQSRLLEKPIVFGKWSIRYQQTDMVCDIRVSHVESQRYIDKTSFWQCCSSTCTVMATFVSCVCSFNKWRCDFSHKQLI